MKKGIFITFEGGEGSGKTTVINGLNEYLKNLNYEVIITREPGGIDIAEQIRDIILDVKNTNMTRETETLLYAASRMQHLSEKVIPALNAGKIIICDRYLDSSLAYQGYARGIGFDNVLLANNFALNHMPDITFFLDVNPETGLARIENRDKLDRIDLEEKSFHDKVYEGYMQVCEMYKDRIIKIDGTKKPSEVTEEIIKQIDKYLNK